MNRPGIGAAGNSNRQIGLYELLRTLGSGGASKVYLGRHLLLDSEAAIKVLRTSTVPEQAEQFEIEARIIAGLRHPHIVRILDFDVENNIPFLVMEFAPHGSLRQTLPEGVPVPLTTVVSYIKQAGRALQYAHDRGVIHLDVKPENMLVGERGQILLTDFGIAVGIQELDTQVIHNIEGTLPYMAPEQIEGRPCEASDQYALAIVVYEWLTGTLPFIGSESEIIRQHLMATPPPLCGRAPGIPQAVERVVMRALSKDPRQRYPSVAKFTSALENASRQVSSSSRGAGINTTQLRTLRLSPLAVSLLFIVFLVLLGSIWGIAASIAQQVAITITPVSRYVTNDYRLFAAPGKADPSRHLVPARYLPSTALSESETIHATGMGKTSGVQASGILTFYNGLATTQVVAVGTILQNAQGIQVVTNVSAVIPPTNPPYLGSVSIPAHALNAGTSGNIAAGSINQTCCVGDNSITVRNPLPFSGGQDPQPFTFVKQSDITGAADSLERALKPEAQASLQKQVRPNEMVVPSLQCLRKVDANHTANERVTNVQVTVAVTCSEWVFDRDAAHLIASGLLMEDALKRLGTNYALAGNVVTSFQQVILKDAKQGIIFLLIRAGGLWVYRFTTAQKRLLARLIADKSQEDARALLLMQGGVSRVTIQAPWWVPWIIRDRLPKDVNHITIDIAPTRPTIPPGQGHPG